MSAPNYFLATSNIHTPQTGFPGPVCGDQEAGVTLWPTMGDKKRVSLERDTVYNVGDALRSRQELEDAECVAYMWDYRRDGKRHYRVPVFQVKPQALHCTNHKFACERLNGNNGSATNSDDVEVHTVEGILELIRSGRITPAEGDKLMEGILSQAEALTEASETETTLESSAIGSRPILSHPLTKEIQEFRRRAEFSPRVLQPLVRPEPGMRGKAVDIWNSKWKRQAMAGGWPHGYTEGDDMPRKNPPKASGGYRAPPNATPAHVEQLLKDRIASGADPGKISQEVVRVVKASTAFSGGSVPAQRPKQKKLTISRAGAKSIASGAMQMMGVPGVTANGIVDLGEGVYDHLRNMVRIKGKGGYAVSNYTEGTSAAEFPNTYYPHKDQRVSTSQMQGTRFSARLPFGAAVAPASGTVGIFSIDINPANVRDERLQALASTFRRYKIHGGVVNFVSDVSNYSATGVKPAIAMGCDAGAVTTVTPTSIWQVNEMANSVYTSADRDLLFGMECNGLSDVSFLVDDGTGLHPPEMLRPSVIWGAYTGGSITAGYEMGQLFVYVDYEFLEPVVPSVPYGALKLYSNVGVTNSTPLGTSWNVRVYAGVGSVLTTSTSLTLLNAAPGSTLMAMFVWWGGSAAVSWGSTPTLSNATEMVIMKNTTGYQQGISCFPPNGTTTTNYVIMVPLQVSSSVGPTQYPKITFSAAMTLPSAPYLDVMVFPLSSGANTTYL